MRCPNCSRSMHDIEYEDCIIQTCDGCGGEFIGPEALTHIVQTRQENFDPQLTQTWSRLQPSFGMPQGDAERLMCCPVCDTAMHVGNYGSDTGVQIDRCSNCGGVWLDRNELEKIQYLVETWRDQAPARIQKCHDELVAAQQRLAQKSRDAFQGSRFAFVNAIVNRLLDAA